MPFETPVSFSVSIVSHGQKELIEPLLADLIRLGRSDLEVVLTLNLPETLDIDFAALPFACTVIANDRAKGFAANHNAAFNSSSGNLFVILNPDISLPHDPFDPLLEFAATYPDSIVSPGIINARGEREDNARRFPTPFSLLRRVLARARGRRVPKEVIPSRDGLQMPDWVAGMFMCMPRCLYAELDGLSERFHLYCEDMDLCARARIRGHGVFVIEDVLAVHNARRDSHKKWKYRFWHLRSMVIFFFSATYWRVITSSGAEIG